MSLSVIIIIVLTGILAIYMFYLIGIYVKLENRRSLILSKFEEVDKQIGNKLDLVKKIVEITNNSELDNLRVNLLNSVTVNDKIKYVKELDYYLNTIDTKDRKVKRLINSINDIDMKIDYAKEFYNDTLYEYNMILGTKSGNIMKKIFKYNEYNTF
ncbi:MAG: LemA family protein [Bacilli bacterium]|nr:LemA family protein [Bacilli bacterium]